MSTEEEIQAMDSLKRIGDPPRPYFLCYKCGRRHYKDPYSGWSIIHAMCSCGTEILVGGWMRFDP